MINKGIVSSVCLLVLSFWNFCVAQEKTYAFEELGQPIRVPLNIEFVTRNEVTGPIAWGAFTDAESNALVGVHMEDGRLIEVDLSEYGKANALLLFKGSDEYIYLYSGKPGRFFKYDIRLNKLETVGETSQAKYWMKSSHTVSPEGLIYVGTYPRAAVSVLNPVKEEVTVIDRVSSSKGSEYVINLEADTEGIVYFATGMQHGELWSYNPKTGQKKQILPENLMTYGAPQIWKATDGRVYGKRGRTTFLCTEEAIILNKTQKAAVITPDNLYHDTRALYLNRSGNLVLENEKSKMRSILESAFKPAAREVFAIGDIYNGKLYGSGMKPGNIFTYDLHTGNIEDLGILTRGRIQTYDILAHKNQLFMASYSGGFVDAFTVNEDGKPSNRKFVANLHSLAKQERLHQLITGPDGYIYSPTMPIKGYLGGTLVRVNPESLEVKVFRDILPNQSLLSVTAVKETGELFLTSSIKGGSSAKPTEKEAYIVLWDPSSEKVTYKGKPLTGVGSYEKTVQAKNGLIYGTARDTVFVFDPINRKIVKKIAVKHPDGNIVRIKLSETLGQDGLVYGVDTRNGRLLCIDPSINEVTVLDQHPSLVGVRFAEVKEDGYLYYAVHSKLFRVGVIN